MKDGKTIASDSAPALDRAFLNIITNHKGGGVITELSAALKQVTAAVQQSGRVGKVTMTMELRPASKGTIGTLIFNTKVKATAPEFEPPSSIFYADADFNLVRDDPNQTTFNLREAPADRQQQPETLREAGEA